MAVDRDGDDSLRRVEVVKRTVWGIALVILYLSFKCWNDWPRFDPGVWLWDCLELS